MNQYKIERVLNNNVVLVSDKTKAFILVGKGIGFGKKKNDSIDASKNVEEKFISLKGLESDDYHTFVKTIDPKVIEVSEKIIDMINAELGESFNPTAHVGMIDHINFAVKRISDGIQIVNPFLVETKLLYSDEYAIAEKAVKLIEAFLGINVPDAEIGFLTLHIYGGRKNKDKNEALQNTIMINEVIELLEKKLDVQIDRNSFLCKRFIMHFRGVRKRILENKCHENIFLDKLKKELIFEFDVARRIASLMEEGLGTKVPESEVGYIAMHIYKMRII